MAPALFTPLKVGNVELQHRIALAPLTRLRASKEHVLQSVPIEYYTQRCHTPGTLVISEATFIAPQASGQPNAPGIYNDEQVASWKKVVDAVHAKGGVIFLQLWALGRAARQHQLSRVGPYDVVSASDIPFENGSKPRPLSVDEIQEYVGWYVRAAKNFVERCGGDGIEIHGANGYLLDQFIQTNSNKRTDQYGGSIENRTRFAREVVRAVSAAIGQERTAIRMSPFNPYQGMRMPDKDVQETFSWYTKALKEEFPRLAYIHAIEGRVIGQATVTRKENEHLDFIYNIWTPNPFIIAGGYDTEEAYETAEKFQNTIVAFGRDYIANPDLVERIKGRIPFNPFNAKTFYIHPGTDKPEGYTDYAFHLPKAKV